MRCLGAQICVIKTHLINSSSSETHKATMINLTHTHTQTHAQNNYQSN